MIKNLSINCSFLFLLGVISSFSLTPYNFFFINFFTFSFFFFFLFKELNKNLNKKICFFYGWLFGFGYFISSLYWVSISLTFDPDFNFLIPFSIILIPAFLALFYGLSSLLFVIIKPKTVLSAFFLFSLLLGTTEFVRGHIFTGFPWNLIVHSFSEKVLLISIVSIIGTYSLNMIIISIFTLPVLFVIGNSKKIFFVFISFILLTMIFLAYGVSYKKTFLETDIKKNNIIIRAVSSNISLDKFYNDNNPETIIEELIRISNPNINKKIFFIWPEGIIPNTYQDELNLYKNIFKDSFNENHIIGLGINKRENNRNGSNYFNSFSVYDNQLNLISDYEKTKLVPFGEFLPFKEILEKAGFRIITNKYDSYSTGKEKTLIKIQLDNSNLNILPLICYEIIYPSLISRNDNFDLIINISEDGWFGKSIGAKQHFTHAIFRALESGKYIIRSANNGIGAIINPIGIVEKKVNFGETGYVDFEKSRNIKAPFFSTIGDKIFGLFILLYIFLIISFNRFKNE